MPCSNIDRRANGAEGSPLMRMGGKHSGKRRFCFLSKSSGTLRVLAIMEPCPRPFSVVMKKEVANVPFLKQVFACMKAIALDREDVRQAMRVMLEVAEEVKKGRAYLIFPEGTRSKMGSSFLTLRGEALNVP